MANITIDGQYGIWFKRSINVCSHCKWRSHIISYHPTTASLPVLACRFFSAFQCAAMLYIHPGTPADGFINGGTPKLRLQANERCLSNSVPPFQETLKGPQIPQASPMDDLSTSPEKHRSEIVNDYIVSPVAVQYYC